MAKSKLPPYTCEPIRRPFNVWRFTSPSSPDIVIKAKINDGVNFQSEYCRILWSGIVFNADDAMAQYRTAVGESLEAKETPT